MCLFVSAYVCLCICLVVLRALKCGSVSKLLLNCSREGLGGYMPCRANGRNITPHIDQETVVTGTNKIHSVHTNEKTPTHAPLSPSSDWSSSSDHLSLPHLFSMLITSFFISSLSLIAMKDENLISPTHSLSLTHSPPPRPFFLICLPTQSGLILLVTVDIWGPAHTVWLSSRDTFPRETLWIQLHTHMSTRLCRKTDVYTNEHMHTLDVPTFTAVNVCVKISLKMRILWSTEETGGSI